MNWTRLRMMIYSDVREKAAVPVPFIPAGLGKAAPAAYSRGQRHRKATRQPGRVQAPIRARTPPRQPALPIREPPGQPRPLIRAVRVHPRPIRAARAHPQPIRAAPRAAQRLIRAARRMNTCPRDQALSSSGREISVKIKAAE